MYIRRKYGNKQLSSSIYLSEAEPFLEQYAPNEEVWRQVTFSLLSFICCTNCSRFRRFLFYYLLYIIFFINGYKFDWLLFKFFVGSESNPFSLDALAVFIYRVVNRVNHPVSFFSYIFGV